MVDTINSKYTFKYALIHSFYWSVFCSSYSFATVFLLSKHFSNSQIGIVLAIAGISAALLQPSVAAFTDTAKGISIEHMIAILTGTAGLFALTRFFLSDGFMVLAVLCILELSILCTLQPLVNALGMQLINRGIEINFGLARGVGSMSYAIISIILGVLVENLGAGSLTAASVGLYLALGAVSYAFMKRQNVAADKDSLCSENAKNVESTDHVPAHSLLTFLRHYKRFIAFLAAIALTFCSHSMINNYLIQIAEHVGGTAKDMGIANAISAALELPAMIAFGFLVRKVRCSSILKFSLFFFALKAAATLWATNLWMLYAAQTLQFCSFAMFTPASIFYVNEIVKKNDLAKGQAFMTSTITLGGVAASFLGGRLLDRSGAGGMLVFGFICAVLGFSIGILAVGKTRPLEYA